MGTIEALVKHINPFLKNSQSIKTPGRISHGENDPKNFKQVCKLQSPQRPGNVSQAGNVGKGANWRAGAPLKQAVHPPLLAAERECEPAFPDLSSF